MDIKSLLDICCAQVASQFKGKAIEELKKQFSIEEDFTPEEEERLKLEHPWAMEGDEQRLTAAKMRTT
jgi:S-phase kinase-associated protein 1